MSYSTSAKTPITNTGAATEIVASNSSTIHTANIPESSAKLLSHSTMKTSATTKPKCTNLGFMNLDSNITNK